MHTYGEQQHLPNSGGFLVAAPVTLWSLEAICTVSTLSSCATGGKQTITSCIINHIVTKFTNTANVPTHPSSLLFGARLLEFW